jgi:hypothetical protein
MKITIDRFENTKAVLEVPGMGLAECDRKLLPAGAKEGDILDFNISIDSVARASREKEVRDLQEKLKKKNG